MSRWKAFAESDQPFWQTLNLDFLEVIESISALGCFPFQGCAGPELAREVNLAPDKHGL